MEITPTKRNSRGILIGNRAAGRQLNAARRAWLDEQKERGVICYFCDKSVPDLDVRLVGKYHICGECRANPVREVFDSTVASSIPPRNLIKQYGLQKVKGTWIASR